MTERQPITPTLPAENPQSNDRERMLDLFAEQPENPALWDLAYSWVRAEGDIEQAGAAGDLPGEELIAMADLVRSTNPTDRYALMTRPASTGKLWFDVIEGFSFTTIRDMLGLAITGSVEESSKPYSRALDLGTGTGKSLKVLEQNADLVVGVDRNPALLQIAKHQAQPSTELVQADVTTLPFADDSFDLITSLGLEGALDKTARVAYFAEIARVLMRGGNYLTAFVNYPVLPSEEMEAIAQSSKATLTDMICDTVSGGAAITEYLTAEEDEALLNGLGLHRQYYQLASANQKTYAYLQIVTKL